MIVEIRPGKAQGLVTAPPSKSMAHRLLICAALAPEISEIRGVEYSQDILATIHCLTALGAVCTMDGDTVTVQGIDPHTAKPSGTLFCNESASTLRFLIPLALLSGNSIGFSGTEKLMSRPLNVYADLCAERGFVFQQSPAFVGVKGRLESGVFTIPGNISSQFVSGLLFALPLLKGTSTIRLIPPVESKSYIDMTLQALHIFGIRAYWKYENTLVIPGSESYHYRSVSVEGDYSNAAFLSALNALGGDVDVLGLQPNSNQGDQIYGQHLQSLCDCRPTIHISDCPDLGPLLFAIAAAKNGALFTGTHRLKLKECDRAKAMRRELRAFGVFLRITDDSVRVIPILFHRPFRTLRGHNDHRVVMALAVLLTKTGGKIKGAESICKSFPSFFEKLKQLGIDVIIHKTANDKET